MTVGKATDVLVELIDEGTDIVKSAFKYTLTNYVENLVLRANINWGPLGAKSGQSFNSPTLKATDESTACGGL
ncbi:hypothetical protein JJB09_24910 [Rhizobium sp. KVB221]|uniref:Uncharacterized protein n=1 Tax=Rhizobium setariae TaxID=2801340 RepID=A0A937CNA3_9HYPH|nr:hypothetical protein [Rhizobium setariae]MBL0375260.1 hypothetical protein [Rhizobium setariae]